ncbi:hypothetical protein PIB30_000510 [Stylosanthes scabra]|uniref:Cyclic nucleotide-binding domain-containing protein n=1 Tax=Stylosanthes scabra TaxID=79078 RepID=A0ABU6W2H6_9FABA|nr:hypothetical protein [Stylosanthes scabra]
MFEMYDYMRTMQSGSLAYDASAPTPPWPPLYPTPAIAPPANDISKNFPKMRTIELYAKLEDAIANFGESTSNPQSIGMGRASTSYLVVAPIPALGASSSFVVNLNCDNESTCDLGDNHTFGELAIAMVNSP